MTKRLRTTTLALWVLPMLLATTGCHKQQQAQLPPGDIYIDVQLPPPTIVNREVIVQVPAAQPMPAAPGTTPTTAPNTPTLASLPPHPAPVEPAAPTEPAGITPSTTVPTDSAGKSPSTTGGVTDTQQVASVPKPSAPATALPPAGVN